VVNAVCGSKTAIQRTVSVAAAATEMLHWPEQNPAQHCIQHTSLPSGIEVQPLSAQLTGCARLEGVHCICDDLSKACQPAVKRVQVITNITIFNGLITQLLMMILQQELLASQQEKSHHSNWLAQHPAHHACPASSATKITSLFLGPYSPLTQVAAHSNGGHYCKLVWDIAGEQNGWLIQACIPAQATKTTCNACVRTLHSSTNPPTKQPTIKLPASWLARHANNWPDPHSGHLPYQSSNVILLDFLDRSTSLK
jgi:hypothetical protein